MSFNSKYKGAEVEALLDKVNGLATQTIQLTTNFNWVSFYVNITLEQLMEAVTPLAQEGKVIQISNDEDTETISYSPENGWDGELSSFDIRSFIRIRTAEACELTIVGEKINPLEMPITLQPGWNYISYPLDVSLSVTEALGFTPHNGDHIKSRAGFSQYYEGIGWLGAVNTMTPGQGYQYLSNAAEPITFTYPSDEIDLATLETKEDAAAKLQEAKDYTDAKIQYVPNESSLPETPEEGVLYLIGVE